MGGVSAARIQEIADVGRQALSTASPKVRRSPPMPKTVSRSFCIVNGRADDR
jgi:hypothetical protein